MDVRSYTSATGGTWTSTSSILDGVLLDPASVDPGIYFLRYEVNVGGCPAISEKEIRILERPEAFTSGNQLICGLC